MYWKVQSDISELFHLVLKNNLYGKYYLYPCVQDEQIEA